MNYYQHTLELIKALTGQPRLLTIPRCLIDLTRSRDAALLLAQILYWSSRTRHPSGWFYKSYADWTEELAMSEYEVRKYSRQLVQLGLIETQVKRAPTGSPTVHYRLCWSHLQQALRQQLQAQPAQPAAPKKILSPFAHTFQDPTATASTLEPQPCPETLNTEPTAQPTARTKESAPPPSSLAQSQTPFGTELLPQEHLAHRNVLHSDITPAPPPPCPPAPLLPCPPAPLPPTYPSPPGPALDQSPLSSDPLPRSPAPLPPCSPASPTPTSLDIYRQVTGRYPPKGAEPLILEAGIATEPERQRWERVIRCYVGCGWNPRNIQGMLDYYRRGELPGGRRESGRGGVSLSRTPVGLPAYRVATPDMFTMKGGFE